MPNEDTFFLKTKVDILSFFDEEQLRKVTPDIERRTYRKGETILFRGEVGGGFYIIKKGRVTAAMPPKGGAEVVYEFAAGDFFGEISLLEDAASVETIRAAEDGTEILT